MNRWTPRTRRPQLNPAHPTNLFRRPAFPTDASGAKVTVASQKSRAVANIQQSTVFPVGANFWPRRGDSPLIQSERGVGPWLINAKLVAPHDPAWELRSRVHDYADQSAGKWGHADLRNEGVRRLYESDAAVHSPLARRGLRPPRPYRMLGPRRRRSRLDPRP